MVAALVVDLVVALVLVLVVDLVGVAMIKHNR